MYGGRVVYRSFLTIFLACALQAIGAAPAGQRLIRLDVSATNTHGEPITNLQASDIQVREDGKARPIAFFRFQGSKRPVLPHAAGELFNPAPSPPLVILLDRWNERMMASAAAWLELGTAFQHMETVNNVFVYFLTPKGDLFPVHPLPGNENEALHAAQVTPDQLRQKLDDAVKNLQGLRDLDILDPFQEVNTTFQALRVLGSQMAMLNGRKNFIWVTHGIPLTIQAIPSNDYVDLTPQVRNLCEGEARAQVAFYDVDQSTKGAGADPAGLSRQTLQMFSDLTGGRWYASDSADQALAEAHADSLASYRIGYYSPVREKDKKLHKVKLDGPKGVRLVTRGGFLGDAPAPSPDQLETASFTNQVRSPFDATEIGMHAALSRKGAGAPVHMALHINPADVMLTQNGGHYQGSLDVVVALYDQNSIKQAGAARRFPLDLTQAQLDQAGKDGLSLEEDFPVSGQPLKLRIMVFDRGMESLGSVTGNVPAAQ